MLLAVGAHPLSNARRWAAGICRRGAREGAGGETALEMPHLTDTRYTAALPLHTTAARRLVRHTQQLQKPFRACWGCGALALAPWLCNERMAINAICTN